MDRFPKGFTATDEFEPLAGDSLERLLEKAAGYLEYLQLNEELLTYPRGYVEDSRAMWEPLVALLQKASVEPARYEEDARLEATRVWAEEVRTSALFMVTGCVHLQQVRQRWFDEGDGELWEKLARRHEAKRDVALRVIGTEDMEKLREHGFLRPGE